MGKNYIGVNIKRIPHLSQTRKTGNLFDSLLHISPGEVYTTQTHLAKKNKKNRYSYKFTGTIGHENPHEIT